MVVLIAMLCGVLELTALIALFGVNAGMILIGLEMERTQKLGREFDWLPPRIRRTSHDGGALGSGPPITLIPAPPGGECRSPPSGSPSRSWSLIALFTVNMVLQYRRVGPWSTTCTTRTPTSCSA